MEVDHVSDNDDDDDDYGSGGEADDSDMYGQVNTEQAKAKVKDRLLSLIQVGLN